MQASMTKTAAPAVITFDTHPDRYAHWRMSIDGAIATLAMNVNEDKGLKPGYKLKLNSYDLGVDIELYDALNRIRFEHPEVRCVVLTSARERMFCSGANIYMLGQSTHGWKVNFCKFTNETRNGMEDSSRNDGLKFLAAVNGTCAGGGYEIALACDEILMIDDRSSTVSLPEVPLLGVLPGTGGLTRITDKRKVRRDLADFFCTTTEGVRADRAKDWGLVDHSAKPQAFAQAVKEHAERLAGASDRPHEAAGNGPGITLTPLKCAIDAPATTMNTWMRVIDRAARTATLTVSGPEAGAAGCDRRHPRSRRRLVAAADGARTRRRDSHAAHQRTRDRHLAAEDPRRHRPRARRGRHTGQAAHALVRARDPRPAAAHAGAPRRDFAHPVRDRRSGLLLRRHAGRTGARRRPRLHAAFARRPGKSAAHGRCPNSTSAAIRW